jgi:tetrahydromethanopterin S-methyltransferase subunit A
MPADTLSAMEQPQSLPPWPVVEGAYVVGDPAAPVAVCALTSDELLAPIAALPGVAIAGKVYTANLGIERIVTNVAANAAIRFLLLCGKESALFRPGQTLCALMEHGVNEAGEIIGAQGYQPVLRNVTHARIAAFRQQVELIDWTDEHDTDLLRARIADLAARTPGPFKSGETAAGASGAPVGDQAHFTPIRLGGARREPLAYDPKGFFVITVDRPAREIVVRHYLPDNTPAHIARGRTTESLALALIREGLISQLSHATYLGAELAKAEAALRMGARYEQDRPLRAEPAPPAAPAPATAATAPPMPDIPIAQTWEQFSALTTGDAVNVVVAVTEQPAEHHCAGTLAKPQEENPFQSFRRTTHVLHVQWKPETRVAMGTAADIAPGALVRARGVLQAERTVHAEAIAILTKVATIT